MSKKYLPSLVCLALILFSQVALAATPEQPKCRMTVESLAQALEPVSHQLPEPTALPDMTPEPIFKAIVGDCCPGNDAANCPPVSGYRVRCGWPECGSGEYSCLYWR